MPEEWGTPSALETAKRAVARGFQPVAVRPRSKKALKRKWESTVYSLEDTEGIERDFGLPSLNVGLAWGCGHADVDLETRDAVLAANFVLPETHFRWGRPSARGSHRVYKCEGAIRKQFKDWSGELLLEVRGDRNYSLIPESWHDVDNEQYEWEGEPFGHCWEVEFEELVQLAKLTAIASAFGREWRTLRGGRHDAALGLSGTLAKYGVEEGRALATIEAVCRVGDDDERHDRLRACRDTYAAHNRGEEISGLGSIGDNFGDEARIWLRRLLKISVGFEDREFDGHELNDHGNAMWFSQYHGHEAKWLWEDRKWYVFDGQHWTFMLDKRSVMIMMNETIERLRGLVPAIQSANQRQMVNGHLSNWGNIVPQKAALEYAQRFLVASKKEFDADPWLLNVENGTLNLKTMELKAHESTDLITKLAPVRYEPKAKCPKWEEFIYKVAGGREGLMLYLQQFAGYCLTGDVGEQVVFFLYGHGANGKTTFLETLRLLLGDDYARIINIGVLLRKQNEENSLTAKADLRGARLVIGEEIGPTHRLDESFIKDVSSGAPLVGRFLYGERFRFDPMLKLVMYGNHKPRVSGADHGFWRRLKLIPFTQTIDISERVRSYWKVLVDEEGPGIMNWLLEGCSMWLEGGLDEPQEVTAATEEFKDEMDVLNLFLEDTIQLGARTMMENAELYMLYTMWCTSNGEQSLSNRTFCQQLKERGHIMVRTNGMNRWKGFRKKEVYKNLSIVTNEEN